MIRPPGQSGAVFSDAGDGDLRVDLDARRDFITRSGGPSEWATARQVHGNRVLLATEPGPLGEGDAIWTSTKGLGVAVFTADCFGVVVHARDAVGVAHAGWRGADAGVIPALLETMRAAGHDPIRAFLGPGIGPCCFEVGPEVSARFPNHHASTTWETTSVDLRAAVVDQLSGLQVWSEDRCTMHDDDLFSFRADSTTDRMVALGWM